VTARIQQSLTFRSDAVDLAAVFVCASDVSLVFEQLQGRVERAGGRGVAHPEFLLQRLDDLIAVSWLFTDQPEDDELHLPGLEHLLAPPTPSVVPTTAPPTSPIGRIQLPEVEVPVFSMLSHAHLSNF